MSFARPAAPVAISGIFLICPAPTKAVIGFSLTAQPIISGLLIASLKLNGAG